MFDAAVSATNTGYRIGWVDRGSWKEWESLHLVDLCIEMIGATRCCQVRGHVNFIESSTSPYFIERARCKCCAHTQTEPHAVTNCENTGGGCGWWWWCQLYSRFLLSRRRTCGP